MEEWNRLGGASTIYEDDEDSSEFASSSSPNPHFSTLTSWKYLSLARKHDFPPDVVIHVQNSSFGLHKEALMARSTFFKRQLRELPELMLSPPLNITAETFAFVIDFCYGNYLLITPLNVAALRTAAELLGMTEISESGDDNLLQKTEAYFRSVIAANNDYASIVLKSCFELLPEAETAAALVSRCIAALGITVEPDADFRWLEEVRKLGIGNLQLILEAVSRRLNACHDLLYRIVDAYLKANAARVSDDQKIKFCNFIDCSILSPKFLMHAVQNPRMPLRFVVQAMFVEQLNTRATITTAADHRHKKLKETLTLGAILERDAALRQVSQMKSIMSATNSRIQTLEKELSIMRKLLKESDNVKNRNDDPARSTSLRFEDNKVEKGQIGSVSSISYRDATKKVTGQVFPDEENPRGERKIGQRLMEGIKSVFRLQRRNGIKSEGCNNNTERGKIAHKQLEDGNEVVIKKDEIACHRRSLSQS